MIRNIWIKTSQIEFERKSGKFLKNKNSALKSLAF